MPRALEGLLHVFNMMYDSLLLPARMHCFFLGTRLETNALETTAVRRSVELGEAGEIMLQNIGFELVVFHPVLRGPDTTAEGLLHQTMTAEAAAAGLSLFLIVSLHVY